MRAEQVAEIEAMPTRREMLELPGLTAALADIADDDCPTDSGEILDERLGEFS